MPLKMYSLTDAKKTIAGLEKQDVQKESALDALEKQNRELTDR